MAAVVKHRRNRHLTAWAVVILVALYFIVPVLSAAEFAFRETTDDAGNKIIQGLLMLEIAQTGRVR